MYSPLGLLLEHLLYTILMMSWITRSTIEDMLISEIFKNSSLQLFNL